MTIRLVQTRKKRYLSLLLLADEQENMIDRYLERGDLYCLEQDGRTAGLCVVTDEGGGVFELKNLAVAPEFQRQGCGRALIEWVCAHYRDRGHTLLVGTGESPRTVPFYLACGFTPSHRIAHFFPEHYDHPIVEDGVLLVDMVYFQRTL